MWEEIVGTISVRTVAMIGDAIRVPTVIDIDLFEKDVKILVETAVTEKEGRDPLGKAIVQVMSR